MTRPGPKRLKPQGPRMVAAAGFAVRQPIASTDPQENDEIRVTPRGAFEWNYIVSCEARNALQVVLSGGEILLDPQFGALTPAQRRVLIGMIENARQIHSLIATLRDTKEARIFGR